jgi:hypothetical protein
MMNMNNFYKNNQGPPQPNQQRESALDALIGRLSYDGRDSLSALPPFMGETFEHG